MPKTHVPTNIVVHVNPELKAAKEKAGPAWLTEQNEFLEKCRGHFKFESDDASMATSTLYVGQPSFFAEADLLRYQLGSVGQRRLGNRPRKATYYCEGRPVQVDRGWEL